MSTYNVGSNPQAIQDNDEGDFVWTDALVKEMVYSKLPIPDHYAGNLQKCLNEFKQSKEDKVKVLSFKGGHLARSEDAYVYEVRINSSIPPEKYEAVKKAIQDCLNEKK